MSRQKIIVYNLERNYPTVEEAKILLGSEILTCRALGGKILKVIHGYGSTGVGGALRSGSRTFLNQQLKLQKIKAVVYGENFTVFDEATRIMLNACPDLRKDRDLNRGNQGVTLILL
ncbi:MAG: hypothetical protein LLG09_01345 [Negativicutes bacterium]|nr:hypothetical protein [Negativicutes bacterium]